MDVKIVQHEEYLEILVWGQYTLEEATDRFASVIATCRLTGMTKVLIDYRKLEGNIAAIQKVIYAVDIVKIYNLHLSSGGEKLLIAYLGPEHLVSTYEPGVKIADKIGIPFKLFTNLNKAREWLQI